MSYSKDRGMRALSKRKKKLKKKEKDNYLFCQRGNSSHLDSNEDSEQFELEMLLSRMTVLVSVG